MQNSALLFILHLPNSIINPLIIIALLTDDGWENAHGTPFRCAWEDGLLDNSRVVQVPPPPPPLHPHHDDDDEPDRIPAYHLEFFPLGFIPTNTIIILIFINVIIVIILMCLGGQTAWQLQSCSGFSLYPMSQFFYLKLPQFQDRFTWSQNHIGKSDSTFKSQSHIFVSRSSFLIIKMTGYCQLDNKAYHYNEEFGCFFPIYTRQDGNWPQITFMILTN